MSYVFVLPLGWQATLRPQVDALLVPVVVSGGVARLVSGTEKLLTILEKSL